MAPQWSSNPKAHDDDPKAEPYKAAREAIKALVALEITCKQSGLDHALIDLVRIQLRGARIV